LILVGDFVALHSSCLSRATATGASFPFAEPDEEEGTSACDPEACATDPLGLTHRFASTFGLAFHVGLGFALGTCCVIILNMNENYLLLLKLTIRRAVRPKGV
jgi:hypothetical protein